MSNKILAFLSTGFFAIVSVVLAYYLNLSKPDVRYTLSEEIPVSFSTANTSGNENVQQLEIRNVGTSKAEQIVVKISASITNNEVIKYISSDQVQVFIDQQHAEFVYPALPPQAGFKIVFISSNVVHPSGVSVSHSTGQAVDALSVSNRSGTYVAVGLYVLFFGGYLLWVIIGLRDVSLKSWIRETKAKRIDQALTSSKPWYLSDSNWKTAHVIIISDLLREEYVAQEKIANSASYGILNNEKPEHFADSDWRELDELAVNRVKDHLSRSIDTYSESSILSAIRLSKPERFPKDDWNTIQKNANEKYIERMKANTYSTRHMVELLRGEKPSAVPEATWQTLQKFCRKSYFDDIIHQLNLWHEPQLVIKEYDLEILDTNQQSALRELFQDISKYKIYKAIVEGVIRDRKIPVEEASSLADYELDAIKEFQLVLTRIQSYGAILEDLFAGNALANEKPSTLSEFDWHKVKNVEALIAKTKDIETRKHELEERELDLLHQQMEVTNEKTTCSQLKDKVLKQLEFINDLLQDPSTMERVESYDDRFSSGNWSNLKQIVDILNSRNTG